MKEKGTDKKIQLAFPKSREEDEFISKGRSEELIERFSASIDEVTGWFKQYQIESIELWISGVVESGEIMKLLVSAKGEGGMKVVLKPK